MAHTTHYTLRHIRPNGLWATCYVLHVAYNLGLYLMAVPLAYGPLPICAYTWPAANVIAHGLCTPMAYATLRPLGSGLHARWLCHLTWTFGPLHKPVRPTLCVCLYFRLPIDLRSIRPTVCLRPTRLCVHSLRTAYA